MNDRYIHFSAAEESIGWSTQAILELGQLTSEALSPTKQEVFFEVDDKTEETVAKFRFTEPVPEAVRRKATEALIHARHSLDQSIFAAHEALDPGRNYRANYPWAENEADLNGRLVAKQIDQRLWETLREQAPYWSAERNGSERDTVRSMASIANNKHSIGMNIVGAVIGARYPAIHPGTPDAIVDVQGGAWDHARRDIELYRHKGPVRQDAPIQLAMTLQLVDETLPAAVNATWAMGTLTSFARRVCGQLQEECYKLVGP